MSLLTTCTTTTSALSAVGFSNRCLLRGERFLCSTTSRRCTSRPPSTFLDSLNRVSRFQHVLLGCAARRNPSNRRLSSAHPPLFKVRRGKTSRGQSAAMLPPRLEQKFEINPIEQQTITLTHLCLHVLSFQGYSHPIRVPLSL